MDQNVCSTSLQVVSTLVGMLVTSHTFRQVVLAAGIRLFSMSPVTLHQRVTFFCQMYATGTHARAALKTGVFTIPEALMQIRAAKLQEELGWDSEQLKQKLVHNQTS